MSALAIKTEGKGDAELISDIAGGRLDGLGVLYDRYESDVRRLVRRLGVATGDLDDVVQTTFLLLMKASTRYDGRCSARAWILGIAAMAVRRQRRSLGRAIQRAASFLIREVAPAPESPAEAFEGQEMHSRLQRALERMSPKKREAFLLVAAEGLSGEEAAATLGIPVATLWTRLHHARREIRAEVCDSASASAARSAPEEAP